MNGRWQPSLRRALLRCRRLCLLVAKDYLARLRQSLAFENRLDDVGVDLRVLFHPHADGLELEDEILLIHAHHARKIFDSDFSHAVCFLSQM